MNSLRGILGAIRKADHEFNLINDGDKILVGVSGGKDSMVLLYSLLRYQQFKVVKFEVVPAIMDLGFPNFDASKIKNYIESLGSSLEVIDETMVFDALDKHRKNDGKLPCSICSRMKKAAMNQVAKKLGCNKVAFAHHADDAIETLFMNELFGARIATFEPKMKLERADITFIRPLILARESEIKSCIKEENIPVMKSHCPNDGYTMRQEIKELVTSLYKKYPESKANLLTMLTNYSKNKIWDEGLEYKIEKTKLSLKPVLTSSDKLSELKITKNFMDDDFDHYLIIKNNKAIGSVKIKYQNELTFIKELVLIKDSLLVRKQVIRYFERKSLVRANPIKVIILDKDHKELYKELKYKKDKEYKALSHLVYVKEK